MADRELKSKRAAIKGTVTRALTYFNTPGEKTAADAKIRLTKLEECWTRFEEIQTKIEANPTEDEEAFAQQLLVNQKGKLSS